MSELKTRPSRKSVRRFLGNVEHAGKREDSFRLLAMMEDVTGEKGVLWGESIVGFGRYHYKYASGREGDWLLTGFSPRKQNLVVYIMPGFSRYEELLKDLGKYRLGRSCLYINKLDNIDFGTLKTLVADSVERMRTSYGEI